MSEPRLAVAAIAAFIAGVFALVVVVLMLTWIMMTPGEAGLGAMAMSAAPMGVSAALGITVCTVASIRHARPVWARRVGWFLSILAAVPALYVVVGVVSLLISFPAL